jgi:ubiquinone/menaquinone biosynthesis C-methylase UbiE
MLDDDEIEKINSRYNSRIEKFGFGIDALASGSEDRRNLRFKVLTEVGVRSGVSVLDVGCGLGDYYRYLRTLGLDVEYTGVDINSALVEECKKRYPDANFYLANIERDNLGKFDFVVSSSSFNLKITNEKNLELIE